MFFCRLISGCSNTVTLRHLVELPGAMSDIIDDHNEGCCCDNVKHVEMNRLTNVPEHAKNIEITCMVDI